MKTSTSISNHIDNKILFTESQHFRQWWLWVMLLGINGTLVFGTVKQVVDGQPFGNNPMSDVGLLLTTGLTLLITVLLINIKLETRVGNEGIYVRFFPFHLSFRQYTWEKISKSFVRQYSPVGEYGGWGIRFGLFGKGKALNVSGNKGLQLEFTDRKKLLIGTNKPGELAETLERMGHLKP